jgi:riboflavin synthase
VQGHVNGLGKVTSIDNKGESWYLELEIPASLAKYVIPEGSIAVDGISLTIAQVMENRLVISVIPHTYKNTTVSSYKNGQPVNIEIDFLARYVEKILLNTSFERKNATFSQDWFKRLGF